MSNIVTKYSLAKMIWEASDAKRAQIVGRACVVIFNNQIESEKQANTTAVNNGVGFTSADAKSGSITAKYFLKHKTLEDWQVKRWLKADRRGTPRIIKYWKQLNAAAQAKQGV